MRIVAWMLVGTLIAAATACGSDEDSTGGSGGIPSGGSSTGGGGSTGGGSGGNAGADASAGAGGSSGSCPECPSGSICVVWCGGTGQIFDGPKCVADQPGCAECSETYPFSCGGFPQCIGAPAGAQSCAGA